jgi:Fe-S cluster assembly protein SufD
MMASVALPTRRQEDWRYSDLEAVASLWPLPAPTRIDVATGETANHHLLQDAANSSAAVHDYVITVADDARCDFHLLNIGGKLGRVTFAVTLGARAHFGLHGAIIGGGGQTLEIITSVTHAQPDATSGQTVRSVLGSRATGSYLGSINVARDAQRTDASQSIKAMLLDRTATANAKPELEIYADDVKCAHGATVGELDKAALFYMASRGMDPATAKTLLLRSFVAGVFDDMPDEALREQFEAAAIAKLESLV